MNKIKHFFKRHPVFYFLRFILISKNQNSGSCDNTGCFNDINDINTIPKIYFDVNSKINLSSNLDEFEKAIKIAKYLRTNIHGGTGLGLSSEMTLKKMLIGEGGVCSDFCQIFNIFCLINDIKVKEWHCVLNLYKPNIGHTFNEFYSSKHQKWIAIDIHKAIYFVGKNEDTPLSVIELFTFLRNGNDLKYISYSNYILKKPERLYLIFSCKTIPYIIGNYKNEINDYYLNKYYKKYPISVIHFIQYLNRNNYTFIFVLDNYLKKLLPKPF